LALNEFDSDRKNSRCFNVKQHFGGKKDSSREAASAYARQGTAANGNDKINFMIPQNYSAAKIRLE